jgi:hypothetical protein
MEAVSAAGVGNKLFVLCRRAIISTGLIDFVLVRFSYSGSGNNTAVAEKVTVVAGSGTGNSLEPTGVAVDPLGRTVVVVGRQTTPVGAFAIGFDATSCLSIWRRQFFGISSFNGDDVGLNTVHATPDGSFVAGGCTGGSSGSGYSSALALRLDAWGRMTWQTAFTSYSGSDSANTTNFTGIASLPAQTTAGINSPCSQDFYMSYSAGPVSNTRSGGVIKLDNAMAAPPSPRARLWGSGLDYTYWEEELTSQGGALVNSAMTIQESTPSTEAYYSITTNITNISLPSTSAFPAIDWYVSSVGTQFDKLNLPSTIYGTSIAVSDFSGFNVDAKWQKKTMQDTSLYLSTDRMFRDRLSRSNAVLMLNRVTTRVGSSHRANILEKTHAYDFGDLPFKVQINGFSSSILNGCCYPNGDIAVVGVTTYDTLSRATLVKLDKYGLKISQMGLYTVNNFTRFTCVDTTAKLGPDSNSANTNVVYAGGDAYPSVGMLVKIIDTAGSYSIAWQKSISLVDEIDTVIANPNGGVFAVGSRQYAGGTGNTEIHLMYFNDAGTRVWSRKLVLDIEGLSFPECVYNPGTGAFYIATFPYTIIKYTVSATGATLNWVKRYDLTQYYGPRGIMLDSVGNVVIASETSYPNYASIIFKLDPNGNPLWARQLPNNNSVQGIVADNAGGVILASQNRSASTALFGMIPNFVSDPGCTWNLGTTGVDLTPIALTMSSITLTETSSTPTVANLSNTIITLPTITVSQTPTYPYTNSNQGYV